MKRLLSLALICALVGATAFAQAKPAVQTKEPKVVADYLTPDKAPKYGGTLVLTIPGTPPTFNYYGAVDGNTNTIMQTMLDPLCESNPVTQQLEPALAKSWDVKGSEVTFKLRDVKWSDGVPFTADDVVFTYETFGMNTNAQGSDAESFTNADGSLYKWVKVDDHTVKCVMQAPSAVLPRMTTFIPIVPKHCFDGLADAKDPGWVNKPWTTNTDPAKMAGTGAFVVEKYLVDQKVVMKRNPYSWKTDKAGNLLPYFDHLEYVISPDAQAAALKFMAGEIDQIAVDPDQFPTLKQKELAGGNFTVFRAFPTQPTPSPTHLAINFDAKNPDLAKLFRLKDFRVGIEYAIDRQKIIDQVYNGLAILSGTPVQPSNKAFYDPKIEKIRRPFDMAKAAAQFGKIGLKKGADGFYVYPAGYANAGKPISFVILSSTTKAYSDTVTLIADNLKKLGFKVDLSILSSALASEKKYAGDYEMAIGGFGNQPDPHLRKGIYQPGSHLYYWHLSTIGKDDKPDFTQMADWEKTLFDIFEKAAIESDQAKRVALYNQYQEIYADQVPLIFMVKGMTLTADQKNLGNVYQNKDGVVVQYVPAMYRK